MILDLMKKLKQFSNTNIIITLKYYQYIRNMLYHLKDVKEKILNKNFLKCDLSDIPFF